ncbi:MAG TPA: alpha/beta hydrolase [Propionicimonas sp.]|jgi:pimeloyl-ACP methyl ester carboxylesterase
MTTKTPVIPLPIVLLGGYWLGPWAWAEVAPLLEAAGHEVFAPTLPGLGDGTPPETVQLGDQADSVLALLRTLVRPVLVVHSGAGAIASAVTDRDPSVVTRVVYVDSGPVTDGQAPRPDLAGLAVVPVPTIEELDAMGPMTADLSVVQRADLAARGVPQPGRVATATAVLSNPARLDVPSTLVCCGILGATARQLAEAGNPMFAPILELHDLDYVDLPGGHWPMWAQPAELADVLVAIATRQ